MFLNNKSILVMCNCIVSMTTHKAILKRGGGVHTKILISKQQLLLEH